jgi:UDP-N-acetylmuramoyl-L-alanyl-D-glutamate--2,6-diaminopimelate ligase
VTAFPLSRIVDLLRSHGLLQAVHETGDVAVSEVEIRGVSQDSRTVAPGDLFLAWKGTRTDAHRFVAPAAGSGAVAAVVEHRVDAHLPQLEVGDGRAAAALVAHAVLGEPGRELTLVGITGTNGKTTTATLARHLLAPTGPSAALGTLGVVGVDGSVRPGSEGLTTPGPVELATWLRSLADEGVRSVAMEASSHALDQRRLDALRFQVAVFTNLGQDHLDYHADLQAYRAAKLRLLELLADDGRVVVHADQPAWRGIGPPDRRLTYGVRDPAADLHGRIVEAGPGGARVVLRHQERSTEVHLPLPGRFNVENALAAAGAALALGRSLEEVSRGLGEAPQVPGRMERVAEDPVPVIIDFAHTPEALDTVLGTLKPGVEGRLVVVFGAGGDRDRTKRAPMARAVARHADVVVLTSDNPRNEDPEVILDDLEAGLGGVSHHRIEDRRRAIARALEIAAPGDLVLLAGKGHERTQTVGGERRPFDERSVVRELLAGRGAA